MAVFFYLKNKISPTGLDGPFRTLFVADGSLRKESDEFFFTNNYNWRIFRRFRRSYQFIDRIWFFHKFFHHRKICRSILSSLIILFFSVKTAKCRLHFVFGCILSAMIRLHSFLMNIHPLKWKLYIWIYALQMPVIEFKPYFHFSANKVTVFQSIRCFSVTSYGTILYRDLAARGCILSRLELRRM